MSMAYKSIRTYLAAVDGDAVHGMPADFHMASELL